jgi:alpha-tubulin suppressor-like RCC1 family protein
MQAMARLTVALAALLVCSGCLKKDPLFCDENSPCTDPARPFCDLQGEYAASEGIKRTCIPDPFPDGGFGGEPDAAGPRAIVSLATSGQQSCAVFNDGGLRCWGTGYLGRGYRETAETDGLPYRRGDIPTGGHVDEVAVDDGIICIRYRAGNVRCWGTDGDGRLGNGSGSDTVGDSETETPDMLNDVPLAGPAKQISLGYGHTCVLLESGDVHCWGNNQYGALGYGTLEFSIDDAADAGAISLGAPATQVAVGSFFTCALLESKQVRCWGVDDTGRLGYGQPGNVGDNEVPDDVDPVDVGGDVVQIATGNGHTCARLVDGEVVCWGHRNAHGHPEIDTDIGTDETPASVGPVDLGSAAKQIIAGSNMSCAVLESGSVRCWGDLNAAENGALGYGHEFPVGDDETPRDAGTLMLGGDVDFISSGGASRSHSCVKLVNGEVHCWGANGGAQLGLGHTEDIGDDEEPDSEDQVRILD